MTSDIERIASLEVQDRFQDRIIDEMRAELKEVKVLAHAINSQLASITHDHAVSSARIEETHQIANNLAVLVDKMVRDEEKRNYVSKIGAKTLSILAAVGTTLVTMYQFRYAIYEFLRKAFG